VRTTLCLAIAAFVGLPATVVAQPAPADSPYYPLKLGTTWQYTGANQTVNVLVARFEPFGGRSCAALEWSVSGKVVSLEHVFAANDGVYRCAYEKKEIVPPLRFLKLPPVAGESWKIDSKIDGITMVGTFQLRRDDVTVPLRRFDGAFASSTSDMLVDGRGGLVTTYWFASGHGLIKQMVRSGNAETVFELVKFEPGK
jgi:hypothetical protein